MKFIIHSGFNKIPGECEEYLTRIDYRTVPTLAEAKDYFWYDDWFNGGINHREERGMIACDRVEKCEVRVIEVEDLDCLIKLQEAVGELVVSNASYVEIKKQLMATE